MLIQLRKRPKVNYNIVFTFLCLSLFIFDSGFCQSNSSQQKKLRKDCFIGIHFDFHAGSDCKNIGETVSDKIIDSLLTTVKPDYIQVDCKGHPGLSSYPTKVGNPAPGFKKDALKIWRDVTNRHNVSLFVHYSGVWDNKTCQRHPEWAMVDAEGNRSKDLTSVFGPYSDSLLIPQLKELIDVYNIDGAWIDGDCWAVKPDYCETSKQRFTSETGISDIPKNANEKYYKEFLEFNRTAFKNYVSHYIDAIHAYKPSFQITSNWAFSSYMPERVSINVDFLSGDLTPQNSVNRAAFESRCLSLQGKPWDIMTWGFTMDWHEESIESFKTAIQLKQEAAQIMAMGGGVQVYLKQNRDASINSWYIPTLKDFADFCRAREPFCHKTVPVKQIVLLHSEYAFKKFTNNIYNNWNNENEPTMGILGALLDGQNSVEIVREYSLNNLSDYPLIVIPECEFLEDAFCKKLEQYVFNGGNLLVIGAKAVHIFEKQLGVTFTDTCKTTNFDLVINHKHSGLKAMLQPLVPMPGTEGFGIIMADTVYAAATVTNFGKGKIAGIYFDLANNYLNYQTSAMTDLIDTTVNKLFNRPLASVSGSRFVHVTTSRLNNKLMINLVNTSGKHDNKKIYEYDEIPPVGPLVVTLNIAKPKGIRLQPGGVKLNYTYNNGQAIINLQGLDIHSIIEVEEIF